MKKAIAVVLLLVAAQAHALMAFFQYERIEGLNKICVYKSAQGVHAITLKAYQICPVTIGV